MSSYTEGQIHQLAENLERHGYTAGQITKLGQYGQLGDFRLVLDGRAEIVVRKHIVDLDADPFVPKGSKVEEHKKGGSFEWDATKVALHLSPNQQDGKVIEGNKLRKELETIPVFNANCLDYLLANPHLIPEEWKEKAVFFWGTIYRRSDGFLYVRYLYWDGRQWDWRSHWLDGRWSGGSPALVLASSTSN